MRDFAIPPEERRDWCGSDGEEPCKPTYWYTSELWKDPAGKSGVRTIDLPTSALHTRYGIARSLRQTIPETPEELRQALADAKIYGRLLPDRKGKVVKVSIPLTMGESGPSQSMYSSERAMVSRSASDADAGNLTPTTTAENLTPTTTTPAARNEVQNILAKVMGDMARMTGDFGSLMQLLGKTNSFAPVVNPESAAGSSSGPTPVVNVSAAGSSSGGGAGPAFKIQTDNKGKATCALCGHVVARQRHSTQADRDAQKLRKAAEKANKGSETAPETARETASTPATLESE